MRLRTIQHIKLDMPDFFAPLLELRDAWRALPLGDFEKAMIKALVSGFVFFLLLGAIERAYGKRTQYRSPMFRQDAICWLYYNGGVHKLLVFVLFLSLIETPIAWLNAHLNPAPFRGLPLWTQMVLVFVLTDFLAYWVHRLQHRVSFLWAFHSVHHSQHWLTFASSNRAHPLEAVILASLTYVPVRLLGASPPWALAFSLMVEFVSVVSHSQIPWTWRMLRHFVVSPRFHAFHHSAETRHHDRNFGVFFSTWDHMFGTAVADGEAAPVAFGLHGVRVDSFQDMLLLPFRLLRTRDRMNGADVTSPK